MKDLEKLFNSVKNKEEIGVRDTQRLLFNEKKEFWRVSLRIEILRLIFEDRSESLETMRIKISQSSKLLPFLLQNCISEEEMLHFQAKQATLKYFSYLEEKELEKSFKECAILCLNLQSGKKGHQAILCLQILIKNLSTGESISQKIISTNLIKVWLSELDEKTCPSVLKLILTIFKTSDCQQTKQSLARQIIDLWGQIINPHLQIFDHFVFFKRYLNVILQVTKLLADGEIFIGERSVTLSGILENSVKTLEHMKAEDQNSFFLASKSSCKINNLMARVLLAIMYTALHLLKDEKDSSNQFTNLLSLFLVSVKARETQNLLHSFFLIFGEQDDLLFLSLNLSLRLESKLKQHQLEFEEKMEKSELVGLLLAEFSPTKLFCGFCEQILLFDHSLFIDFLTSNETSECLVFFLNWLKRVISENLSSLLPQEVLIMLKNTRNSLSLLHMNNAILYNPSPLCKKIDQILQQK